MASTNHTENYALPQWERTDPFQMEDFNDAFEKIDEAIAGAGIRVAYGQYTGDGTSRRFISLDFTPQVVLVLVFGESSKLSNSYYGGLSVSGYNARVCQLEENGFTTLQEGNTICGNENGAKYTYLALG